VILAPFIFALLGVGPPRAGVELRLGAMEAAALAGDADAWLATIAPGDATFAAEQRRFADDLRDHPPLEFDLSIADDPAPVFMETRAELGVVLRYCAAGGHAKDGKTASWPAVFVFADPDGEGPRAPDWLYQGENWLVMPADGFEVRYLPGAEPAARDILEAFPVAKAHDDEGFEIENARHQVIKLYSDMEHLKATVYLTMPDEVLGGWNEAGESIKFMSSYTRGVEGWTGAMAHEYGHVATWELGPHAAKMPWWVQEGAAELAAEEFLPGSVDRIDAMIRGMAQAGTLPSFDQIADYRTTEAPLKIMAYHQGHHIVGYISERWGRRGRNQWLGAMAKGATLDEATTRALGMLFTELDAAWRASLTTAEVQPGGGMKP
jgi:hypothetical protein